jgi:hypothetical protein
MDWRSLAQVKELGITVRHSPCMCADLAQIFSSYWLLGAPPFSSHSPVSLRRGVRADERAGVRGVSEARGVARGGECGGECGDAATDERTVETPQLPDYFDQDPTVHQMVGPLYNSSFPLRVAFSADHDSATPLSHHFFTAAPPPLCPLLRDSDLSTIVSLIHGCVPSSPSFSLFSFLLRVRSPCVSASHFFMVAVFVSFVLSCLVLSSLSLSLTL